MKIGRKTKLWMFRLKVRKTLMDADEEMLNIMRQEIINEKNRRNKERTKNK